MGEGPPKNGGEVIPVNFKTRMVEGRPEGEQSPVANHFREMLVARHKPKEHAVQQCATLEDLQQFAIDELEPLECIILVRDLYGADKYIPEVEAFDEQIRWLVIDSTAAEYIEQYAEILPENEITDEMFRLTIRIWMHFPGSSKRDIRQGFMEEAGEAALRDSHRAILQQALDELTDTTKPSKPPFGNDELTPVETFLEQENYDGAQNALVNYLKKSPDAPDRQEIEHLQSLICRDVGIVSITVLRRYMEVMVDAPEAVVPLLERRDMLQAFLNDKETPLWASLYIKGHSVYRGIQTEA